MSGNRRQKFKKQHDKVLPGNKLPEELIPIVNAVPKDKRQEVTQTLLSVVSQIYYSGPIPSPEMLKQYDEIYPGLSKEIVENAFSETKHRHKLEKEALPAEIHMKKLGQIFGFIIALFGIGGAILLAYIGHDTVAAVIGGTTVLGLVSVFVIGKKSSSKQK